MNKYLIIFLFGGIMLGFSQENSVLTYDEFINQVIENHPVAEQANLAFTRAKAESLIAKGALDPTIESNYKGKEFKDKTYYQIFDSKLKIPTILGIDVFAGYSNTNGYYLNPQNKTDENGLWKAGIEANVLQGLWRNERRTALQQAKIYQSLAETEKQIILNELLLNASKSYVEWQKFEAFDDIYANNIELANAYKINTVESFLGGEKTAMDTLEAHIQWQDAENLLQKNLIKLNKAKQSVENFLWFDEIPMEIKPNVEPQDINQLQDYQNIEWSNENLIALPLLAEKRQKLEILALERKLKQEKFKPKLKLKYTPLISTKNNVTDLDFNAENYQFGFDFYFPILMREARGNLLKTDAKIAEVTLDIQNKQNEIQNKITVLKENLELIEKNLKLQEQNLLGYKQLLYMENMKFDYGESSVFILNKRQEKFIDGQIKYIELLADYQKNLLELKFYQNQLM